MHDHREWWDGRTYPVLDAEEGLKIFLTAEDIKKGVPHTTNQCAIAQACRRQGWLDVEIKGSVAYLLGPSGQTKGPLKGKTVLHKFTVPVPVRKVIREFDETNNWTLLDGPIDLRPVCPSWRKEAQSKRDMTQLKRGTGNKQHRSDKFVVRAYVTES